MAQKMAFSCYQSSKWNLIFSSAGAVCSIYFHVSLEGNDLSPFQSVSTPTSSLGRSDQLPKPLIMFQTHFKLHRHQLEYQNIRSTLVTTSIKEWGRFGLKKKKKAYFPGKTWTTLSRDVNSRNTKEQLLLKRECWLCLTLIVCGGLFRWKLSIEHWDSQGKQMPLPTWPTWQKVAICGYLKWVNNILIPLLLMICNMSSFGQTHIRYKL